MSGVNTVQNQNNQATKASAHLAQMRAINSGKTPVQQNNVQSMTKCPHGFPGGACPICMGQTGGGAGGANNKKEVVPGMTWNEAYAIYYYLMRIKKNNIEDQKSLEANRQRNLLVEKLERTALFQKLAAINTAIKAHVTALRNAIVNTAQTITTTIKKAVNKAVNLIQTSVAKLIGVVNKLTAMMGERLKAIKENIEKGIKSILSKMLEVNTLNRLITIFNDKKRLLQNFLLRKVESLKEKILKFTDLIRFFSKDKNKQGKKRKNKKKKSEHLEDE